MSHLSLLTNKTQTYWMMKKAAANRLRNQLKKILEKHLVQELKSTTKMLASFASKKEKNYTEFNLLKLVPFLKWLNYFQIRVFSLEWTQFQFKRRCCQWCQISPEMLGQHSKKSIKNQSVFVWQNDILHKHITSWVSGASPYENVT